MAESNVTLALAAFLDSPQVAQLEESVPREDVRKITGRFLRCCFEQVGKAPRFLDGQDVHGIVGHLLPPLFGKRDPLAEYVPAVLRGFVDHLAESEVVSNLYEMRKSLEETLGEFRRAVETGEVAHHAHEPVKPFVHGAQKAGRNDPCPCGSGKKFKKCHGKA